eukprot:3838567-Pyramimonas_sp.AAC.1
MVASSCSLGKTHKAFVRHSAADLHGSSRLRGVNLTGALLARPPHVWHGGRKVHLGEGRCGRHSGAMAEREPATHLAWGPSRHAPGRG